MVSYNWLIGNDNQLWSISLDPPPQRLMNKYELLNDIIGFFRWTSGQWFAKLQSWLKS